MTERAGEELHHVGEPISFSGYVDDFDRSISAIEFSLDDGAHWTAYDTPGTARERGVSWQFRYTPEVPGSYRLKVRAVDGRGEAAFLVAEMPFRVIAADVDAASPASAGGVAPADEVACAPLPADAGASIGLRALGGGPLEQGPLFRSGELADASPADAALLVRLGVSTVFDIRTRREVAARPDPRIPGAFTVALEPGEGRRKDAARRLVAGVIGEYGAPEERMRANYRRYVQEYPLIGTALRTLAQRGGPALIHCANGKDRTGVLCAVVQRLAGVPLEAIVADYVAYNHRCAARIEAEASRLSVGMTPSERAILMSFLEARPAYLHAFFDEVDARFGSFATYVAACLRVTPVQADSLRCLAAGRSGCDTMQGTSEHAQGR